MRILVDENIPNVTAQELRTNGDGEGIHWPDLDEDMSVEGILAGRRSAESDASLARWIVGRKGTSNQ
jgi:hypothetical protein